jgi:citrate lyase subunit beta/citryl-CoA lyase
MPAANERALEKAKDISADALILDLEDAVAPAAKEEARVRACEAVASGAYKGKVVTVRVNSIGTKWHEADLHAVATVEPDAIVVPKINSVDDVREVERGLDAAGAPESIRLWVMIETPAAVLRAAEIAGASCRLSVLVMGTNDLINELRAQSVDARGPLLASLSFAVLAARARGRMILDGVYNDVRDLSGFASECAQGRSLGFDGKTLIHPGQVETCNRVFSPSDEELSHARHVIEAFDEAERTGLGVATVDGRLVESLHVEIAKRTLLLADGAA